jgi:hypothetical protein
LSARAARLVKAQDVDDAVAVTSEDGFSVWGEATDINSHKPDAHRQQRWQFR